MIRNLGVTVGEHRWTSRRHRTTTNLGHHTGPRVVRGGVSQNVRPLTHYVVWNTDEDPVSLGSCPNGMGDDDDGSVGDLRLHGREVSNFRWTDPGDGDCHCDGGWGVSSVDVT